MDLVMFKISGLMMMIFGIKSRRKRGSSFTIEFKRLLECYESDINKRTRKQVPVPVVFFRTEKRPLALKIVPWPGTSRRRRSDTVLILHDMRHVPG
jgi:hypothetical protein